MIRVNITYLVYQVRSIFLGGTDVSWLCGKRSLILWSMASSFFRCSISQPTQCVNTFLLPLTNMLGGIIILSFKKVTIHCSEHLSAQGSSLDLLVLGIWTNTVHPNIRGSRIRTDGSLVYSVSICKGVSDFRIWVENQLIRYAVVRRASGQKKIWSLWFYEKGSSYF